MRIPVANATDEFVVYSGNDDGYLVYTDDRWIMYMGTGVIPMVTTFVEVRNWFRYQVFIPHGATIDSAQLDVCTYQADAGDVPPYVIRGFDEDNAAAPGSATDFLGRPLTDSYVEWILPDYSGPMVWYSSPDIKSVIQEIVNRDGWSSGNYLVISSKFLLPRLLEVFYHRFLDE